MHVGLFILGTVSMVATGGTCWPQWGRLMLWYIVLYWISELNDHQCVWIFKYTGGCICVCQQAWTCLTQWDTPVMQYAVCCIRHVIDWVFNKLWALKLTVNCEVSDRQSAINCVWILQFKPYVLICWYHEVVLIVWLTPTVFHLLTTQELKDHCWRTDNAKTYNEWRFNTVWANE